MAETFSDLFKRYVAARDMAERGLCRHYQHNNGTVASEQGGKQYERHSDKADEIHDKICALLDRNDTC